MKPENKSQPKRFFLFGFALILAQLISIENLYSQKYDLIVSTGGDSIACYIDSVTNSKLFFEMRLRNKWTHTFIEKGNVQSYEVNKFNKKELSFKTGTSFIVDPGSLLINQINRNIIYGTGSFLVYHYTTTLNYERIYKVSDDAGKTYSYRFGYGIIDNKGSIFLGTLNYLKGSSVNKFETNIGATFIHEEHSYGPHYVSFVLNLGYRFQSPDKRLVFRAGAGTPEGVYLSIGYSF